jgi:uncharacterized GH25 family protein
VKRAALLLVLVCAPIAGAHDFWIEPSTFRPSAMSTITASLRVGEDFEGEAVPRRAPRIESFVVRDASGERQVAGFEGRDPAGVVRIERNGTAVIGYRGKPYPHEISRAKFEQFLREEGVEGVRPRGNRAQRERFQRFAKSILGSDDVEPLGFPFELVVEGNVVRVLYEQKPLANAYVAAISRDGRRLAARTDGEGRVTFDLGRGVWLIKSVHLLTAPKDASYDWDSLWASVTLLR